MADDNSMIDSAFEKELRSNLVSRLHAKRIQYSLYTFGNIASLMVSLPTTNMKIEIPFIIEYVGGDDYTVYYDNKPYELTGLSTVMSFIMSMIRKSNSKISRFKTK